MCGHSLNHIESLWGWVRNFKTYHMTVVTDSNATNLDWIQPYHFHSFPVRQPLAGIQSTLFFAQVLCAGAQIVSSKTRFRLCRQLGSWRWMWKISTAFSCSKTLSLCILVYVRLLFIICSIDIIKYMSKKTICLAVTYHNSVYFIFLLSHFLIQNDESFQHPTLWTSIAGHPGVA